MTTTMAVRFSYLVVRSRHVLLPLAAHVDGKDLESVRVAIHQAHDGDVQLAFQTFQK